MHRIRFICQKVKTSPPAQVQKFCGLLLDTRGTPELWIPTSKVSRCLATLDFVIKTNAASRRALPAKCIYHGGTFIVIGQRDSGLYWTNLSSGSLYYTCPLTGKDYLYYTSIELRASTVADLGWWHEFLQRNPGNPSRSGAAGYLTVNSGDGSGTGTGGTSEIFEDF